MPPKKKSAALTEEDLKVKNYYECIPKEFLQTSHNPNFEFHKISLPFRMVVVAPSGSGKSNFVFHLLKLFGAGEGTFRSIYIITANSDEPLYNAIKAQVPEITILEGIEKIPKLDSFDKEENHLVIFDDLVLEKHQEKIEQYYIRARKKNVSVIYLSQKYHRIPLMIRANANYTAILKIDGVRDTKLILSDYGAGLDKDQLWNMYDYATRDKFYPLFIDVQKPIPERFRKGISEQLDPHKFI